MQKKAVDLSLVYGFTYGEDKNLQKAKEENSNRHIWEQYVKPREDRRHQWVAFVKPEDSSIKIRDFIKGVKYTLNPTAEDKKGKNVYKPKQEGSLQKRLFDNEVHELEIEIKLNKNTETKDGERFVKIVQQLNCDAEGRQDSLKLELTQYV